MKTDIDYQFLASKLPGLSQKQTLWLDRLIDWQSTGGSLVAYAEKQQLKYTSLIMWRKWFRNKSQSTEILASSEVSSQGKPLFYKLDPSLLPAIDDHLSLLLKFPNGIECTITSTQHQALSLMDGLAKL